jgi:hypothetical protein
MARAHITSPKELSPAAATVAVMNSNSPLLRHPRFPWAVRTAALAGLCLVAVAARADQQRSALTSGATVQSFARIVDAGVPRSLVVTAGDIAAGYVEVHPASMRLITNSREGVAIDIRPLQPAFTDVEVAYGDGVARMAGDSMRLVRRGAGSRTATLPLTYRFRLQPGTTPCTYAWPLGVSATSL